MIFQGKGVRRSDLEITGIRIPETVNYGTHSEVNNQATASGMNQVTR